MSAMRIDHDGGLMNLAIVERHVHSLFGWSVRADNSYCYWLRARLYNSITVQ